MARKTHNPPASLTQTAIQLCECWISDRELVHAHASARELSSKFADCQGSLARLILTRARLFCGIEAPGRLHTPNYIMGQAASQEEEEPPAAPEVPLARHQRRRALPREAPKGAYAYLLLPRESVDSPRDGTGALVDVEDAGAVALAASPAQRAAMMRRELFGEAWAREHAQEAEVRASPPLPCSPLL